MSIRGARYSNHEPRILLGVWRPSAPACDAWASRLQKSCANGWTTYTLMTNTRQMRAVLVTRRYFIRQSVQTWWSCTDAPVAGIRALPCADAVVAGRRVIAMNPGLSCSCLRRMLELIGLTFTQPDEALARWTQESVHHIVAALALTSVFGKRARFFRTFDYFGGDQFILVVADRLGPSEISRRRK